MSLILCLTRQIVTTDMQRSRVGYLAAMLQRATLILGITHALVASALLCQSPSNPPTTASLRGLSVAVDGTIWASGTKGTVLRSTDDGRSWELRSIAGASTLDLRDVEAVSAQVAYAMVAGTDTARIYRTSDGGQHWIRQYDDVRKGVFLDGLAFWDRSHGIALGDPMDGHFLVLRTDDGGAHWTQLPEATAPGALPGEAAFAASGTAIAVGAGGRAWIGTGGVTGAAATARVFRSSDFGRTWEVSETPMPSGTASTGIFSLAFRDALHGVAVGGDYANPGASRANVAVTSDGGKSWELGDRARATAYLSGVAYVPSRKGGWAVVGVGTAGTFQSRDDGRTWTRRDSISYNAVAAIGRSGSVVAAGDKGRTAVWQVE